MNHKQRIVLQSALAFSGLIALFPPLSTGETGFLLTIAPWEKVQIGEILIRVFFVAICSSIAWLHFGRDTPLESSSYNRFVDKTHRYLLPEKLDRARFFVLTSAASVLIAIASKAVSGMGTFILFYLPFSIFYLRCVVARTKDMEQSVKKWLLAMSMILVLFPLSADNEGLHKFIQVAWGIGHFALLVEKRKQYTPKAE